MSTEPLIATAAAAQANRIILTIDTRQFPGRAPYQVYVNLWAATVSSSGNIPKREWLCNKHPLFPVAGGETWIYKAPRVDLLPETYICGSLLIQPADDATTTLLGVFQTSVWSILKDPQQPVQVRNPLVGGSSIPEMFVKLDILDPDPLIEQMNEEPQPVPATVEIGILRNKILTILDEEEESHLIGGGRRRRNDPGAMYDCLRFETDVQRLFGVYPTGFFYDMDMIALHQLKFEDSFFFACLREAQKCFSCLLEEPPGWTFERHFPALLFSLMIPVNRLRYALDFLYNPETGERQITEFFNAEQIFNWGTYDCEDGAKYLMTALFYIKAYKGTDGMLLKFQEYLENYYVTNAIVGASPPLLYDAATAARVKATESRPPPTPHVTCLLVRKDLIRGGPRTAGKNIYMLESTCPFYPDFQDTEVGEEFLKHWSSLLEKLSAAGSEAEASVYPQPTNFVGACSPAGVPISDFIDGIYMLIIPELARERDDGVIRYLVPYEDQELASVLQPGFQFHQLRPFPPESLGKVTPKLSLHIQSIEQQEPPSMKLTGTSVPHLKHASEVFQERKLTVWVVC